MTECNSMVDGYTLFVETVISRATDNVLKISGLILVATPDITNSQESVYSKFIPFT
jgi:hypothetical protein